MIVGRVAPWTRSGGATARAGVLTFPRSIGMVLADPAAVLAEIAFHRSPLLPRITLTADLAYSGALGRDRLNHGYLDRRKALFKRSNGVPKIVPACCQRRGEDRIRGVGAIRHPRSLLFGGNVAIEELNSPIEVDNHLPDLCHSPYDGFARTKNDAGVSFACSKWSISAHLGLFPACPYDRSQNPCHLPALRTRFRARPGVGDSLPSQNAPAAILESGRGLPKQNLRFSPRCLTDLASIARDFATMRTLAVIFVLALIAIAGGICSDPVMMSGRAPHTGPDPVTLAVAHAVKSRPESRP